MTPCPDCGCMERRYRRDHAWLAIICACCQLDLHGIALDRLREVHHEAA